MEKIIRFFNKSFFRALLFAALVFPVFGFSSCVAAPPPAGNTVESAAASAPVNSGEMIPEQAPSVEVFPADLGEESFSPEQSPAGFLQINFVDSLSFYFREEHAPVYYFPEEDSFVLELPYERDLVYRQIWDSEFRTALSEAILQFEADDGPEKSGPRDVRSTRAYGTAGGMNEWFNPAYQGVMKSEPRIDFGYLVKGGRAFFLVTQREAGIPGDASGRFRSPRLSYCVSRDQADYLLQLFEKNRPGIPEGPYMVFLGDSVTAGTSAVIRDEDNPASAYPALLQELLRIYVINSGVRWSSSAEALEALEERVLVYQPEIVVIHLGLTDFLEKTPPALTRRNLQSIITALDNGERKIFLVRFYDEFILRSYMSNWEMGEREQDALLSEYNWMYQYLGMYNNIELVTGIWENLEYNDTISEDYINPNADGHYLMAENFYRALMPYLEERGYLK